MKASKFSRVPGPPRIVCNAARVGIGVALTHELMVAKKSAIAIRFIFTRPSRSLPALPYKAAHNPKMRVWAYTSSMFHAFASIASNINGLN